MKFFSIYESFGSYNRLFNPQPADVWDTLHTSTKQNSSAFWAESEEELAQIWADYWDDDAEW